MRVVNGRLRGQEGRFQIQVQDGRIHRILPWESNEELLEGDLDAEGGLMLPPYIEPHIHLDSTLTAGEPHWNESGTLFEGIERWAERKQSLTREDVIDRAKRAISWQMAQGIQFIRTHVDVTDPKLVALQALLEVREELRPWVEIQIVAFPQEGICSFAGGAELLEEALRMGADVVGAIPHYEYTREYGVESLHIAFELATRYDRLVDVHCDEIDDEQSRFVEVVAAEALRLGMGDRTTASHTTAMHSYNNAYAAKLLRLAKRSGIHFVANPLINIHLQGRFDTYPKRRGVTRVKEMLEMGIHVGFGHDDIYDPWYPLGTGNMMQVLQMGIHVCYLMGHEQIEDSMRLITDNSARVMHLGDSYGLVEGRPANLIILPAPTVYEAIRRSVPVRYSIRHGEVLVSTTPGVCSIHRNGREELITFERP